MSSIREAHPLSEAIYEGVLEKPPWKTLLKCLEEYLQVTSATLVLRRPKLSDPGVTVYLHTGSDALEAFRERGYRDSPFAELPEKKVFTLNDRVTRSELKSLDFYQHFLEPYRISDLIGFDVYDKQSHIRLRLRLVRMEGAPAFSQDDRARLGSIIPMMDKALKLYSAYVHNSFIEELYDELLGSMDIASLILNAKLEVLSANHQAQMILVDRDGVFLLHNSLRCRMAADQEKLTTACRELLAGASGFEQDAGTESISISRVCSDTKWDVHIKTIAKRDMVFDEDGPKLVLLLQSSTLKGVPSQPRLIDMLGVTPAEAKLILQLLDGLTLTDAAKELGISRNTARAQLSSIFSKTGVNRQTQLVRLVSDAFAKQWK